MEITSFINNLFKIGFKVVHFITVSGCIDTSPGLFGDVFYETTGACVLIHQETISSQLTVLQVSLPWGKMLINNTLNLGLAENGIFLIYKLIKRMIMTHIKSVSHKYLVILFRLQIINTSINVIDCKTVTIQYCINEYASSTYYMNDSRLHLLNVLSVVMCTLFILGYTSPNQNYFQSVYILELYKKYSQYQAYN